MGSFRIVCILLVFISSSGLSAKDPFCASKEECELKAIEKRLERETKELKRVRSALAKKLHKRNPTKASAKKCAKSKYECWLDEREARLAEQAFLLKQKSFHLNHHKYKSHSVKPAQFPSSNRYTPIGLYLGYAFVGDIDDGGGYEEIRLAEVGYLKQGKFSFLAGFSFERGSTFTEESNAGLAPSFGYLFDTGVYVGMLGALFFDDELKGFAVRVGYVFEFGFSVMGFVGGFEDEHNNTYQAGGFAIGFRF